MNDLQLEVSVDDQQLRVIRGSSVEQTFPVSTSAKGIGFTPGSYRTPTGHFEIADKIGAGMPRGTIFSSREPVGQWQPGDDSASDLILTRILRIRGLEPDNANSYGRYIYFHGTNQEEQLGTPASHGCIRLSNEDMLTVFDLVETGTPLHIIPPVRKRGKLIFFDCDSTLSTIEGIDELGRSRGPEVFALIEELTNQAMSGQVPINEVFQRRMEIIRPDRGTAETVADLYLRTIVPGIRETLDLLRSRGWTPVILSGGFAPLIMPLAHELGIRHVEAVPLYFDADGNYAGYGIDYPTTRNGGKPEIIRSWKQAMLPERVIMVGDGISDLEARSEADCFIGFGGVVQRPAVQAAADLWLTDMSDFGNVASAIL